VRRYSCGILVFTLIVVFGLIGCGTKVSLGLTTIINDDDGISEPLGIVRIKKDLNENISIDCEHISSAFEEHDVLVLDHCGLFYNF